MLFDTSDAEPDYIVAADIRKSGEEEAGLWNDEYSYSSMLDGTLMRIVDRRSRV